MWLAIVIVFLIWNWSTYQSRNLPANTFTSDSTISIEETDDSFMFKTLHPQSEYEIVFLQGGMVDPKAYAPLCRKLASYGFTSHLLKIPLRMPVWNQDRILNMFDFKSGKYVLAGHSQGAKIAAQLVYENPTLFQGLILIGSSHPRDIDMSRISVPTVKIYAEFDGLASTEKVFANSDKLPFDHELLQVKGGNHSQFGYIGKLLMDNKPKIAVKEQQHYTFAFMIKFMNKLKNCYQ